MLYAGYYNLTSASQASSRATSAAPSRRGSDKSTDSQTQQPERRRSSIKRALDMLRPTEEPLTVADIYAPAPKQSGLFSKKSKASKEEKAKKQAERYKWNMERARYELISAAA